MPKVTEIHLVCTPEEWEVLCRVLSDSDDPRDCPQYRELTEKISAINKRLVFASSIAD